MSSAINRRALIDGASRARGARSAWDHEFDIVIAGLGVAAISAAIEGLEADPKAKILLLEKMPEARAGGNSRASGQGLVIPKDKEAMKTYQRNLSVNNPIPEDFLEYWADQLMQLHPWIKARAKEGRHEYTLLPPVFEFSELGAKAAVEGLATILPQPGGLWAAFKANIDKRPVTIWYESPAKELVQDPDSREVYGVIVKRKGKEVSVRARRGVILACGGYAANPAMQRDYAGYADAHPFGSPGNTGDGIHMLQRAGADLWHMRNWMNSSGFHIAIKVPDYTTAFMRAFDCPKHSWIEIGKDNKRFGDETYPYNLTHYKYKQHGQLVDTLHHWVMPVHMIFDETVRKNFCLTTKWMTWNAAVEKYDWSPDNSAEIEKGWIVKGDTLSQLAFELDRDYEQLARTVTEYNAACAAKADLQFGRDPATLEPIVTPPYYAVELKPGLVCTSGGGRRNIHGEVLDPEGKVIPGLYEAGELGSMVSDLYQNGTYLTEAMISGRAAGRSVAKRS